MYSYQKTEPGQWSVGSFADSGQWKSESVWYTQEEAAERAHWLNGGKSPATDDDEALSNGQK
ncbi:MAG: hypothetical protein LKJ17_09840 [Oscillospiraceae bacterium]|jgi:hypothetical protein|nr:hypothetical protein [Oscillospiraceae bacterium]